jgi:hypothetical protein
MIIERSMKEYPAMPDTTPSTPTKPPFRRLVVFVPLEGQPTS